MVKREHYVSQGILKSFCNDSGKLYEFLTYESRIYQTKPINAMCESHTYEHENIPRNQLENEFAELEKKIIPLIDELILRVIDAERNDGSLDEIKKQVYKLLPSLLVFYYRSNALLQEYSMGEVDFRIQLMLKKIMNHDYIFRLAEALKKYSFCVIKSQSTFLLSDQYISTAALKIKSVFVDISNRHMGLKDTLVLIPLSKDYYVAFWHSSDKKVFEEGRINKLDENRTFNINRTIINNSYTKCVSAEEDNLRTLSSYWTHQSPTQIFIGHSDKLSSGFIKKKEIFYNLNDEESFKLLTDTIMLGAFMHAKNGDWCPCHNGRLFKNCHLKYVKLARPAYEHFGTRNYIGEITIDGSSNIELPIDSWGPMSARYQE